MGGGGGMGMGGMGGGMNATPAPTPPPSPKPKKQQYQTDQTKPFVFPFSPEAYISKRMVPYAIDEADELYEKHLYVSLALFQIWRTREDYLLDESGLEAFPGESERDRKMKRWSVVKVRKTLNASAAGQYSAFSGMSSSAPMGDGTSANGGSGEGVQGEEQEDDDEVVTWPDSKVLEEALERAEKDLRELDRELARMDEDSLVSPKKAERRRAKERRDDLLRLQRAETIYVRAVLTCTICTIADLIFGHSPLLCRSSAVLSLSCSSSSLPSTASRPLRLIRTLHKAICSPTLRWVSAPLHQGLSKAQCPPLCRRTPTAGASHR
jgi:hypothetical protein